MYLANRAGRPDHSHEPLNDPSIAEEEPEPSELIVHQCVHRVQDHRPNSRSRPELLSFGPRLARQLAEDRQEKALRLSRACPCRDNQASPINECELGGGGLMLVGWVVE